MLKNTGLQGSTLSGHAGHEFGPFKLPTSGLLQKGTTTSRLRLALSEEPSSRLAFTHHEYSNY